MQQIIYDAAVVGGGIAGYTAALTLHNFHLNALWLGQPGFGEKLAAAEHVRNFPSYSGDGKGLAALLSAQSAREGIVLTPARIDAVYRLEEHFVLSENQTMYAARAVILATGVESGGSMTGEREFFGRGVSYCAVCDGALYRGRRIAVVISSAEFAEEVEFLAGYAAEVYAFCLYRDPAFRAPNIRIMQGMPRAVEGGMRVERLRLNEGELLVDGVFFLKHSSPPAALVGGLETEGAHVRVDRAMRTNIRGLFAAGDVTGRPYQYIKAAGEGLVAAFSARDYLLGKTE